MCGCVCVRTSLLLLALSFYSFSRSNALSPVSHVRYQRPCMFIYSLQCTLYTILSSTSMFLHFLLSDSPCFFFLPLTSHISFPLFFSTLATCSVSFLVLSAALVIDQLSSLHLVFAYVNLSVSLSLSLPTFSVFLIFYTVLPLTHIHPLPRKIRAKLQPASTSCTCVASSSITDSRCVFSLPCLSGHF